MHTTNKGRGRPFAARLAVGVLIAASLLFSAPPAAQAADESVSVDFAVNGGSPTYRASGWIYGMTEDASGPPDHFYEDVNFQYMRAGGAQLDGPGGWVAGKYDRRWNATEAQLLRTKELGGEFILLLHDLWGADGYPISRFPGDGGNWTDYDAFLNRVIADVQATGQTVQWDLWNEPNLSLFWNRPQSQYFELWERTYDRVRQAFPNQLIVGPSLAGVPTTATGWWTQYLDFAKSSGTIPDIVSWHSLPSDPVANVAAANSSLDSRGIAHPRPYQINEYGASNEQNPGDGSWYIARLERAGANGLRANWASAGNLHNDLGNLLTRDASGQYQPKGEWWVYRFYAQQTGTIVGSTPSSSYDPFATKTTGSARVLVGGGGATGNVAVDLRNLNATSGIVQNNQVRALVQRIPYNSGGAVTGPVTVQDTVVTLSGNGTTVNLPHTNADETFTITLLPPTTGGGTTGELRAEAAGKCLDVPGVTTAPGTQLQIWGCWGGANQQWTLTEAGELTVYAGGDRRCLDAYNGGTANGTAAVVWNCNGGANQRWNLNADGTVTSAQSGLCLDVSGYATSDGAKVHLWTCHGGSNQQWNLQ